VFWIIINHNFLNQKGAACMNRSDWDWSPGEKIIADLQQWRKNFHEVEAPCVSPDGERIAAVVRMQDAPSFICETKSAWKRGFDKIWGLRFLPDNRLLAIVSAAGKWTVAVEGVPWENWFDFVWDVHVCGAGCNIVAAAQNGGAYFAVLDGIPWRSAFPSLSNLTLSPDGRHSAAVVQTVPFNSGDVFQFRKGCYTVARDGNPWPDNFLNIWDLTFSPDSHSIAAESRISVEDYTIVVDGKPWQRGFLSVWKPLFHPFDHSVTAPVKIDKGWSLAKDGEVIWQQRFFQLWHHAYSRQGNHIAAIAAPGFGRWTIAVDGKAWPLTFNHLVTDMVLSPDGERIACIGKTDAKWHIAVDAGCWDGSYDMIWEPVFSDDSRHVAVKAEKKGEICFVVDGVPLNDRFVSAWDPVFGPSSDCVLLKGITRNGVYVRHVFKLAEYNIQ
jgi:hypothetical protein